ncbi:MAG: glycosyltransferase [Candidatus Nanopelagicales bacterium]
MGLVVAVIPVHQPDHDALVGLVDALLGQGTRLVVADDGSPGTAGEALREAASRGAVVVPHDDNRGIARSLNDGLRHAVQNGAEWLLTVDQDSTVAAGYVAALVAAADEAVAVLGPHSVGALAAARVDDASGALGYPTRLVSGLPTTEEVIQSGTLWSVPALVAVGGFDEAFGIDAVDAAACVRLRAAGRRIVLAPGVAIGHRVGAGRRVRVLGRAVLATGHPPERRTTIVRNRLALAGEEFAQSPRHALRTLRRVAMGTLLAVTIEDHRWAKAKASAAGLRRRPTR